MASMKVFCHTLEKVQSYFKMETNTMNDLIIIADSLLQWAQEEPYTAPLAVSAARDILCLAEAELRLSTMTRTASEEEIQTLPEMFDRIRNTNRDCSEILNTIYKMEQSFVGKTVPELSMDIGRRAIDRLTSLANSSDAVGNHRMAKTIDGLISDIMIP